jgi:MFS family permease
VRYTPPQWDEMSPGRRFFEAAVLPSVFGLLCGLALGFSGALYLVGVVLALLGGIGGGAQYARRSDALLRGLVAGALFGAFILLGFELGGEDEAKVDLPDPHVVLLVFTIVPSLFLHWLGWRLRPRLLGAEAA